MSERKRERIWELDALRGFLILCVILSHSLYYAVNVLHRFTLPGVVTFVMQNGGVLFVLLSGLCATLGSRSFRRGLLVFAGGMALTLGSLLAVRFGWLSQELVIRFGVLHLLGAAMMLYPLLNRLQTLPLVLFGLALLAAGYWLEAHGAVTDSRLLFPLGLRYPGFTSGDYFPLAPHLGWFCLGIALGRSLYAQKRTRLPQIDAHTPILRFFCFCGRHSLAIFILHLPILGGVLLL